MNKFSKKYLAIFQTELRQMTTYAWDFVLGNITVVLFFYVLLQVWQATITPEELAKIEGNSLSWDQLIWFLAAGQILYFSVQTEAQLEIEHDVISGNIVTTLARPYDYLLARFASVMAHTLLSFAVAFPCGIIVAWAASGTFAISIWGILAFSAAFAFRSVLFFLLQATAGLATFWIEKATAFVWVLGLLILVFGGGAVPIEFWPEPYRSIIELTPFPAMMYYPAKLLIDPSLSLFFSAIFRAVAWLVILGGIVAAIYHRALRRLDINGG
jgi:ABC-2 type transport system permease protein